MKEMSNCQRKSFLKLVCLQQVATRGASVFDILAVVSELFYGDRHLVTALTTCIPLRPKQGLTISGESNVSLEHNLVVQTFLVLKLMEIRLPQSPRLRLNRRAGICGESDPTHTRTHTFAE